MGMLTRPDPERSGAVETLSGRKKKEQENQQNEHLGHKALPN